MVFKSQLPDSIPPSEYKDLVSNFFWHQLDKFSERILFVDYESKREWRGQDIKRASELIARNLINLVELKAEDDCVFFYKNSDYIYLVSLATIFSGASVCVGEPDDPEHEQAYMLKLMKPSCVFIASKLVARMLQLRVKLNLNFTLIVMNDDEDKLEEGEKNNEMKIFGLHRHLLNVESKIEKVELPIQVRPDKAAFVLFSSGSTGQPKAVGRSQRNSLYVCFSLPEHSTKQLWHLNESSVLAGQLQLDHGTGTFSLKMTITKGLKLIVMQRYKQETLLNAIEQYKITDCMLGSALLHNLIIDHLNQENENANHNLSSLKNFITVGSPIVSRKKIVEFMQKYPQCSIRQSFGMTECGFMTIVERNRALPAMNNESGGGDDDDDDVGPLLPNLTIKLINRDESSLKECKEEVEVNEFNKRGELYVFGPTVSPGYLGDEMRQYSRDCFQASGYYKSSDMCMIINSNGEQRLKIIGRYSEVLCLYDGWKVLPAEIEQLIMEHPSVREAAVVGVPHPTLPTCHAPRAYIVLKQNFHLAQIKDNVNNHNNKKEANHNNINDAQQEEEEKQNFISEKELFDFVAKRCSEPKHLIGGIKFVQHLPRISIGKVDKKLLKRQDGYA